MNKCHGDFNDPNKLQLARAYVTAHDTWWRSLVTPPFNKHKCAEHEALARAQREAWVAFGGGIDEAREMIKETNYE